MVQGKRLGGKCWSVCLDKPRNIFRVISETNMWAFFMKTALVPYSRMNRNQGVCEPLPWRPAWPYGSVNRNQGVCEPLPWRPAWPYGSMNRNQGVCEPLPWRPAWPYGSVNRNQGVCEPLPWRPAWPYGSVNRNQGVCEPLPWRPAWWPCGEMSVWRAEDRDQTGFSWLNHTRDGNFGTLELDRPPENVNMSQILTRNVQFIKPIYTQKMAANVTYTCKNVDITG